MAKVKGMSEEEIKEWCKDLKCKHLTPKWQRRTFQYIASLAIGILLFFVSIYTSSTFLLGWFDPWFCLVSAMDGLGNVRCLGLLGWLPTAVTNIIFFGIIAYSGFIGTGIIISGFKRNEFQEECERVHLAWLEEQREEYRKKHPRG